jgi:hypothetical protein
VIFGAAASLCMSGSRRLRKNRYTETVRINMDTLQDWVDSVDDRSDEWLPGFPTSLHDGQTSPRCCCAATLPSSATQIRRSWPRRFAMGTPSTIVPVIVGFTGSACIVLWEDCQPNIVHLVYQ